MGMFGKKKGESAEKALPRHIAFIMDGNGRWARRRALPRTAGHAQGARVFEEVTRACFERGIAYVTVYAFSTENWKRPKEEVDAIMSLLSDYLDRAASHAEEQRCTVRFLGDKSVLPPVLRAKMEAIERETAGREYTLCVAFNYGGRAEIVSAAAHLAQEGIPVTEESLSGALSTAGIPDPDLIVRTAGEMRLSNFLLWQAAYAEFYSTKTLWPSFGRHALDRALSAYAKRHRRYGGL